LDVYALNRELMYYDAPTVRAMVEAVEKDGHRLSRAIVEVVKTRVFRYIDNQPETNTK
jgi:hypothetical protein